MTHGQFFHVTQNEKDMCPVCYSQAQQATKEKDAMTFHWANGWYFSRLPDGSVEVRNHGDFDKPNPNHVPGDGRTTLIIPAAQWASIVCSVSKDGETGERWNQAQDFHGRT